MKIIKQITRKELNNLISSGIIGECCVRGNDGLSGRHSCGYYDVNKYNEAKKLNPEASDGYLKAVEAHVGVSITKSQKIYIEDSYVK